LFAFLLLPTSSPRRSTAWRHPGRFGLRMFYLPTALALSC